jgi:hypothetical protein
MNWEIKTRGPSEGGGDHAGSWVRTQVVEAGTKRLAMSAAKRERPGLVFGGACPNALVKAVES